MKDFSQFYNIWRPLVQVRNGAAHGRALYFQEPDDHTGFDQLESFFDECGEDWAVTLTSIFEEGSTLASRLDATGISKFRMIQDRHLVNFVKMAFDDDYHHTSDERALFLIFSKVPPVRFCSAMARAKNATLGSVDQYCARTGASPMPMYRAISSAFMIELNHTLRAYVYFERFNSDAAAHFEVAKSGDESKAVDYSAPTRNRQMTLPDKSHHGSVELF